MEEITQEIITQVVRQGGMGFKYRADQISHTLPTTRHRCNLDCVDLGAKLRRWAPLTRDTRKGIKRVYCNEDLILICECGNSREPAGG